MLLMLMLLMMCSAQCQGVLFHYNVVALLRWVPVVLLWRLGYTI